MEFSALAHDSGAIIIRDRPRSEASWPSAAAILVPRGAAADYDSWEQLGNPNWGWDGVLPFFKKVNSPPPCECWITDVVYQSETFNPPSEDIAREFKIKYNNTAHGFNGPISSGFPNFLWPSMSE